GSASCPVRSPLRPYRSPPARGGSPSQTPDIVRIGLRTAAERRRPRDQHVGSGVDRAPRVGLVDTAVDLEVYRPAARVDPLADRFDLLQLAVDEALPAEARIDAHHQHEIGGEDRRGDANRLLHFSQPKWPRVAGQGKRPTYPPLFRENRAM